MVILTVKLLKVVDNIKGLITQQQQTGQIKIETKIDIITVIRKINTELINLFINLIHLFIILSF